MNLNHLDKGCVQGLGDGKGCVQRLGDDKGGVQGEVIVGTGIRSVYRG